MDWSMIGSARARLTVVLAVIVAAAALAALPARPARASATFTVTSTADTGDATPDGVCDTCTLREAIEEANANPGADAIAFDIPGQGPHTIRPDSELPPISDVVTIDGYTQAGARRNTADKGTNARLMIELDGSDAGDAIGLAIEANDSIVSGLAINRFLGNGVALRGNDNTLAGNFIGTDPSGNSDRGNGVDGVAMQGSAQGNTIGGAGRGQRNLLSGNARNGVQASGNAASAV